MTVARRLRALARVGLLLAASARALAAAPTDVRLPAVEVDAEERSIVTVRVPVPDHLREQAELAFTIRPLNGASIVGATSGLIDPRRSRSRVLVITVRVPADLAAGPVEVADVEFRAAAGEPAIQPVVARIPVRRVLRWIGVREIDDLRSGDRVDVAARLHNDGNAPESLRVVVQAPSGWPVLPDAPRAVVIPRGAVVEVAVMVQVPARAGVGDHMVTFQAASPADTAGTPPRVFRTVMRVRASAATVDGLTLMPVLATATSSGGGATFVGATLDGPVREDVRIQARLMPRTTSNGIVLQGLGTLGAFAAPFAATVIGRDWRVSAGNALVQLNDLAGVNLLGEGLSAALQRGEWTGQAIAARPSGGASIAGSLLGAGLTRDLDVGRFGVSASRLVEQGGQAHGRDLSAVAADLSARPIGTVTLNGALAYRQSFGTAAAGYGIGAVHERPRERLSLRFSHAPGGSAAFARAVDELSIQGGRLLTDRWSLDASYSGSRDRTGVFRALDSRSWSVGQRVALTPASSVTMRGTGSKFDARTAPNSFGAFGSASRELAAGYDLRVGALSLSAEGSMGRTERANELFDGRVNAATAAQRGVRLFASWGLQELGAIDASTGVQYTEAGVGIPSEVLSSSLRWSGLPFTIARQALRLDSEVSHQRLGGLQSFLITRAMLSTSLSGALDLGLLVERNPFYRSATGSSGWVMALRLTGARRLRDAAASGDAGIVFEDRDGDGRRDPGEPGVRGVSVRRGDARVTTDAEGRYRMPARVRGRVRVEQGSLPEGMLPHPLLSSDSITRLDVPLLATGTAVLVLRLTPSEDGRVPDVDLGNAIAVLRDQSGFEWVGRNDGAGTIVFEDIPAGAYTPRMDFTRVGEPLRIDDGITVIVVPRAQRATELPVRGRAIRLTIPPARSGSRGAQRR